MRIFPVGRRVLVRKDEVEEVTEGGIVLTQETVDGESRKQAYGTVLAIAKEAYEDVYEEKQCAVGDRVIFRSYAGVQADPQDGDVLLINDQDVLAVFVDG